MAKLFLITIVVASKPQSEDAHLTEGRSTFYFGNWNHLFQTGIPAERPITTDCRRDLVTRQLTGICGQPNITAIAAGLRHPLL